MFLYGINIFPSVPGGCLRVNDLCALQIGTRNKGADAQRAYLQKAEPWPVQRSHPIHDVEGNAVFSLSRYQWVVVTGSWNLCSFCGTSSVALISTIEFGMAER